VKVSSPHLYVCFKSPADRNDFYQLLLQQKGFFDIPLDFSNVSSLDVLSFTHAKLFIG